MKKSPPEIKKISKLIELNEELENYFRNTIIPQLFVDSDLILRKYTPPAMKQFQFTKDHIGLPMEDLVDNIRYSTIMENINEVIDTGDILEKEIQTTDSRWFQMNIIPYIDYKINKANGVIITFIDVTDRIRDMKELEILNSAHETFIYSVSHDLKAPLANIESLINALNNWEDEDDHKNVTEMLETSVKSMRSIIDELTEITKIEGNYQENIEVVDLNTIVKEVKLILKDQIVASKAKIHLDLQVNKIGFSRKNLRSIVYNLLSNAVKYKSNERIPEISINSEQENDFIKISVKDNGLGIAEDKKDFVFTQFTRLEKHVDGTGIGLYLLKKIVDNNGGYIVVNSDLGKGSEFQIYLKPVEMKH